MGSRAALVDLVALVVCPLPVETAALEATAETAETAVITSSQGRRGELVVPAALGAPEILVDRAAMVFLEPMAMLEVLVAQSKSRPGAGYS